MKRKLALLLTLLLTLSLVNFIPAAASADMDTTVTLGDFVVTYDSAAPIEASFDSTANVLSLKQSALATSPATCEVSFKEGLTRTNCDILAEGELYIVLKGIVDDGDLSLAAGSNVTLEPQDWNQFNNIKTSATAQSPAALTITGSQAEGNSLLTCTKVSLANASLTVSGGELGAFNGMTCSHFYMWSGKLTMIQGAIYCADINLSGGDLSVISTTGGSALSSEPKLGYPNGYYWCASSDAGLPNTLTDGAQTPYEYSPEHKAVRFLAKDAILDISGEGEFEEGGSRRVLIGDGSYVVASMEKDIGVAVPYSFIIDTGEAGAANVEAHDLNLISNVYASDTETVCEPIIDCNLGSNSDFAFYGYNTFTSTSVAVPAVNLASGSELSLGSEGTNELNDFIVTYDSGAGIEASFNGGNLVLKAISPGAVCEVSMRKGVAFTKCDIYAEGSLHIILKDVKSLSYLYVNSSSSNNNVTLELNGDNALQYITGNSSLTITGTGALSSQHTLEGSLTIEGGSLSGGISCSALYMRGGKIDVNGGIKCDDINLSGGDLTAKNPGGSALSSEPKLDYPNGYSWCANDTYTLPETLTDYTVAPYEYSTAHKAVRLVAKDAPKTAPVSTASTAGVQASTATSSGTLTINAAGAGFDGTGKLTLNNLPLTITSGTGKAFGSLTNVELNYPNGYIWRTSKTGEYHNSEDMAFVLDDYTYVEILPIIPDMFEGADGYITRTYEDWLREQAEKDLMAPPSGLQPDPTTEPEDLFAD